MLEFEHAAYLRDRHGCKPVSVGAAPKAGQSKGRRKDY